MLIRKAKEKLEFKSEKMGVEIDAFKSYPIGIMKTYFDLIYSVNVRCLTIIEIIQLIDISVDCGFTGETEYPMHFRK